MATDEQAAGTPGATSEGAVADSGTPVASQDGSGAATVDADEIKKLRDIRDQFLREKDNTERIRQENEMLRQQVEQASRVIAPPTGYDPVAQRLAQTLQSVNERDPEMVELLTATARMTQEQIQKQQLEQRFYRELAAVPSDDQAEVERISRTENLWPNIAMDRLKSRRYDKERTELAEQRRKLQEQEDRLKRGVVKTTAEPAPPASKSDEITSQEYDRIIAAAQRGDREARKKLNDIEDDVVRVRPG